MKSKRTTTTRTLITSQQPAVSGTEIGANGIEYVLDKAASIADAEARRIAAESQAQIEASEQDIRYLKETERDLLERRREATRNPDAQANRHRRNFLWVVAAILSLGGFLFTLIAFAPYQFGWKGYIYAVAVAIVCPFAVEETLDSWGSVYLLRILRTVSAIAALASLLLLAQVRGDILARTVKDASAQPVVTDDHASSTQQSGDSGNGFYDASLKSIQWAMILLALGMELAAGISVHGARKLSRASQDDATELDKRLKELREKIADLAFTIASRKQEAEKFRAEYQRDFHREAIKKVTQSAKFKLLVLTLGVLLLPGIARAADKPCLVILTDLTESETKPGPDGKSGLEKNLDAVTQMLAKVPASTRVTVAGITGNSFTQPYVLLTGQVGDDPGYFGERLASAHKQLVMAWAQRRKSLKTGFQDTDILGALLLTTQLFVQDASSRKTLIILSDMRQHTPQLDLETPTVITQKQLAKMKTLAPSDLRGVQVEILGADGSGKTTEYWLSLRSLWEKYFKSSGGKLTSYSPLRISPESP